MEIFKAYDIRGIYPSQIDENVAKKIGYSAAKYLNPKKFVIGCDVRNSSPDIKRACIEGLLATGCEVIDVGIVSTPCLYFATAHLDCDGGIIITASHNPPEYTGLKVCREQAIPIGVSSGLQDIKKIYDRLGDLPEAKGQLVKKDITDSFRNHVKSFARLGGIKGKKVVMDFANGVVAYSHKRVFDWLEEYFEVTTICAEPDGNFPNHEPDPLKDENIEDLRKAVVDIGADFGVSFDGDGDRLVCIDETGSRIEGDILTCILGTELLTRGDSMVYDVRSSMVIGEEMASMGVTPIKERVGHAFIKKTMRDNNAVFGGELSGHYYFRDNYYADSGEITFAVIAGLMSRSNCILSEIAGHYRRYAKTGEINFNVDDTSKALAKIKERYSESMQEEKDGLTVITDDYWFNLRPSNTEPLLRLNAEAKNKEMLDSLVKEISGALGSSE